MNDIPSAFEAAVTRLFSKQGWQLVNQKQFHFIRTLEILSANLVIKQEQRL